MWRQPGKLLRACRLVQPLTANATEGVAKSSLLPTTAGLAASGPTPSSSSSSGAWPCWGSLWQQTCSPAWSSCVALAAQVRCYARHPQSLRRKKLNVRATREAVAPFIDQPTDPAAAAASSNGPIIDTAIPPLPEVPEPQHYQRIGQITGPYSIQPQLAFAVVQLGPKQYKVTADDVIFVNKLKDVDINDVLLLGKVLLTGTQEETVIGRPYVPGSAVVAAVEEHFKDAKVYVFKKKKRKRYTKLQGHRSHQTALRILEVRLADPGAQGAAAAAAAESLPLPSAGMAAAVPASATGANSGAS